MIGIMRSWAGLGVILHSENRLMSMRKGGHGAVVEVPVSDIHDVLWQSRRIQCEAVVLAGDLNLSSGATWMVEAAMAIRQLERAPSEGQTQNLVAKTDPEQREIGLLKELLSQRYAPVDGGRIAGTVGKEHAVR